MGGNTARFMAHAAQHRRCQKAEYGDKHRKRGNAQEETVLPV